MNSMKTIGVVFVVGTLGASSPRAAVAPAPAVANCEPTQTVLSANEEAQVVAQQTAAGVESRFATVNGVKLHYLHAGSGSPIILLHGYAETSHMWLPLIPLLSKTHTVIAPDLRGAGQSEKPEGGYTKKAMAQDIHALAQSMGLKSAEIVGHDIGLMVAYAYAAMYPDEVERIALLD